MTTRTTTAQLSQRIDALDEAINASKSHLEKQNDELKTIIESQGQSIDEVVREFRSAVDLWADAIKKIDEGAEPKAIAVQDKSETGKSAHSPHIPFSESVFGRIVGYLPTVIPWALALGAIVYIYRARMVDDTVTPPTPAPDVPSITKAVGDYFPTQRKEFAAAFADAANKVRSKEIINDEQLDALINPQLKAARDLANKPFDVSFDMGLPRNDDGTFSGKEEAAAKFLEQISRSW
jgi:predicted RNase H-like HicB family nuclease